jgi:hypothetical protein
MSDEFRHRPADLEQQPMMKTYPIGVVLSVASHKVLCDFSQIHEAVTDLAGWPVMSHHLGNCELVDAVAAKLIGQVRWLPGAIENMPSWLSRPPEQRQAAIEAWLGRIAATHGETVTVDLGEPLPVLGLHVGLEHLTS